MTDGDSGLSRSEEAQWDAIVASEWPNESAILTTQLSRASVPIEGTAGTVEPIVVTMYQPRRPGLTPLTLCALAFATSAWLTIQAVNPAYQRAVLAGISRSERAAEVHDFTVAAVLVAIAVVVASGCIGIWTVAAARYRLRRSSCRLIATGSNQRTVHVRPPNPATVAAWILLIVGASSAGAWWIPMQLERSSRNSLEAIGALHLAALGATTWLAVFLLCAIGLTMWAAREGRHRLRRDAAALD